MMPTSGAAVVVLSGTVLFRVSGKVADCASLADPPHPLADEGALPPTLAMSNAAPPTTASGLRDALIFHAVFFSLAIPVALTARGSALGLAVLLLALLYNIALPLVGHWRGHAGWVQLWAFLLPLSCALPCADWMLVVRMGTLTFPDHGIARLGGAVPVYFMGLWMMLLWQVCWIALATRAPFVVAALLSFAGFVVWEWAARPLQLWHAVGVKTLAGFALYPLIPEVLLALAALWMWRTLADANWPARVLGALSVAVFYAGALSLALLVIG